jgi:type I restriction enzyme, S subunit
MTVQASWKRFRLDELCCIQGGGTPSRTDPTHFGGPIPWVTPTDLPSVGKVTTLSSTRETLTTTGLQTSSARLIPAGSVLFSSRASIGKIAVTEFECATNQGFINFTPHTDKLRPWFLAYLLAHYTSKLSLSAAQTTFPEISRGKLRGFEVEVPDVAEQDRLVCRIRESMERVDEIENLRLCIAQESEQLRFASVSSTITQLKTKYGSACIWQLVGESPSAMRSGPFGSAMKHHEFVSDGNLVIGIANVQRNRFNPVRKWMIDNDKFHEMKRYQVEAGDILVTIMGTIGRTCVVPQGVGAAITSKHVYRIRFPESKVLPQYVSYVINFDDAARRHLYGTAAGGVMPGLNSTKLKNLSLCVPPLSVQQSTVGLWDDIHAALNERETLHLDSEVSQLRRAILRNMFAREL